MCNKDQNQGVLLIPFNFLLKIKLLKMIKMNHQNLQNISKKLILNKYKILIKKQT